MGLVQEYAVEHNWYQVNRFNNELFIFMIHFKVIQIEYVIW